ncbi:hypothetical protein B0G76_7459 [Paraburkholderia sp. BL23I1N1]|uniref:hypothetical protein n=1 Tax=Paraburkholderia sp. BL23I1N1 TaxID=1938802 RepID=UPI000E7395FE|nr:hypothetical protein [Paraburkholderia sp. BL23I1N1]RKE25891.1 hypothetical protein B0G76_7459 [Paraburkholderia sp. BL23I1N1]
MENNLSTTICALLSLVPLCTGCSYLETRPGHPESYNKYYDEKQKWDTTIQKSQDAAASAAETATPVYRVAKTPIDIWKARGYAYNFHLQYKAASFKAQDVEDVLAVPVFGLAVATVAVGLAHVGTAAVAGTALGGAALGAGVAYLRPDKDVATDQAADAALLCVVDQSKDLNNISAIPLVLDVAALQDALDKMRTDAGALMVSTKSTDQQAQKAFADADSAAESAIKAVNAAISAYVALPGNIYAAADAIDSTARAGGARSLDYGSVLSSLQTSAKNQSATDDAKTQLQKATTSAAANTNAKGAAVAVTAGKQSAPATTLTNADAEIQKVVAANVLPPQPGAVAAVAGKPATNSSSKTATLKSVLDSTQIGDIARVNALTKTALDDIPDPNFSAIAATIKSCSAGK